MLFIPYETWEEVVVRTAGPSSFGSEFLVQAAAQGKRRFVGSFCARAMTLITRLVVRRRSRAPQLKGEFPYFQGSRRESKERPSALMAAAEMGQPGTVKLLLNNGATPVQWIRKAIQRRGLLGNITTVTSRNTS